MGASLGSVGVSWAILARLGRVLWASWRVRGHLGGFLGPSLGVLGGFWQGFGGSWRISGSLLDAFLEDFLQFQAISENSKNH